MKSRRLMPMAQLPAAGDAASTPRDARVRAVAACLCHSPSTRSSRRTTAPSRADHGTRLIVSALELLGLLAAGVGAGLAGSIAGLASLVSYPALLAVGLGPVTANVTNTVGLVFNSLGSTIGSRTELRGQGENVRALALVAVLGGSIGAGLLLI